jgi:hypothetical protein
VGDVLLKLYLDNKIKSITYSLAILLILSTEMIVMVDAADTSSYDKPLIPNNNALLKADGITIKSHFNQIHNKKYSQSSMNCSTKSHLFGSYLLSINAKNVEIMDISSSLNCEYGHEVILWDNRVYDTTSGYYNVSKTEYLEWIETKEFEGLITETAFVPTNS